jgi:exo-1,4-beta-D-glucosaminidase
VLDFPSSNYYTTPAKYSDMTGLVALPRTKVEWSSQVEHRSDEAVVRVNLRNAGQNLAFLVNATLKNPRSGDDLAPVLWDDNYVSLLPGESKTLAATVRTRDLGSGIVPQVVVTGWNIAAEGGAKAAR